MLLKSFMKDDRSYFSHIVTAIDDVQSFIDGLSFTRFQKDEKTINAVIYSLIVIGEAANHVSLKFCNKHKKIEWKKIRGMRNRVIHEYFDVDEKIIWNICKKELPALRSFLSPFLKD